jgi:predicted HAD superfamily Cof-like phosphohydrolase
MTTEQKQVKQFMQFFNQDCPEKPTQLTEDVAKLRAKLILEEALETITKGLGLQICLNDSFDNSVFINEENLGYWLSTKEAFEFTKIKEVDLEQLADGLGDLHYVAYTGTGVAAGIDMEEIFAEIHSSNMTKAWTEGDLEQAKVLYPTAKLEEFGGGLYRLVREDGKIIKSPSYRPANIKSILEKQSA